MSAKTLIRCSCGKPITRRNYQGDVLSVAMIRPGKKDNLPMMRILAIVNDEYPQCVECFKECIVNSVVPLAAALPG